MKRKTLLFFLLCSCLLNFSFAPQLEPMNAEELKLAKLVYKAVNNYRESLGLRKLKAGSDLNDIALEHSRAMARGQEPFSHNNFKERVSQIHDYARVPYRVAENLYAWPGSPRELSNEALRGWINSPGHHKNMKGNFIYTGVAVAKSESGEYFVTQVFVGRK